MTNCIWCWGTWARSIGNITTFQVTCDHEAVKDRS